MVKDSLWFNSVSIALILGQGCEVTQLKTFYCESRWSNMKLKYVYIQQLLSSIYTHQY